MRVAPLSVGLVSALAAQAPIPNPHWGASAWPREREEVRLSLSLNRFTELDGENRRFNAIDQSAGFDVASVLYNRELMSTNGARYTVAFDAGAGVSNDQPTEFLQNDYIHRFRHLDKVPTDGLRRDPEYLAGLSATRWFGAGEVRDEPPVDDRDLRFSGLIGTGLATSTLYHEMYAHVGGAVYSPRYHVRAAVFDRMSLCTGGDAYPDVAPFTNLTQVSLYYVPRSYFMGPSGSLGEVFDEALRWRNLLPWNWPKAIHDLGGRPEIGLHVTYDTGLFLDERGQGIDTWFVSLSMEWPTGLRLETWNDMANGTDFGPTYGMMISFDLSTLWRTTMR